MDTTEFDVLVVGGGAAGLIGALEIALTGRTVAVVEAKNRVGGRILTFTGEAGTVEAGAEFVHGNLPLTKQLLHRHGINTKPASGRIWQYRDGQLQEQEDFFDDYDDLEKKCITQNSDKTVERFLTEDLEGEKLEALRFTLTNYVEGYYAADIKKASTAALCEELTKGDDEQFRVEGGYGLLVAALEKACRQQGVQFFLSEPVMQVQWKQNRVAAITEKRNFAAKKMLVTVSLGVLKAGAIPFFPALPPVAQAVRQLGFGHVIKPVFQFEEAFWKNPTFTNGKDLSDLGFLFSHEEIPTWWAQHPGESRLFTGWLAGPEAEKMQFADQETVRKKALTSLSRIFGIDIVRLEQRLQHIYFYNWSADPFFAGAYSYEVVGGGEFIRILQQPVEETLFFAGEGLQHGPEIGTVEGALVNGRDAAHRLIATFSSEKKGTAT